MPTPRELFQRFQAQTSPFSLSLEIERAEGAWLYTPDGQRYLDLISGISVSFLGHSHPRIVEAIQSQAARSLHLMVYGEVVQSPPAHYAQALVESLPPALDNVYFVNSGSEAIEGALKLAKRATARPDVLVMDQAYHGSTHGPLAANGAAAFRDPFRPLPPGFRFCPFGGEEALSLINRRTAAVLVETVQGEAGVRQAPADWWQKLQNRCQKSGTLLILDEIQAGMGRTGPTWAFEKLGIVPDILVSAKALGGGMPLGAFIAPKALMRHLSENPYLGHITTFGGHPVSCAAGLAAFRVLQEEKIGERIPKMQAVFAKLANAPLVQDFRAAGLLMALELGDAAMVQSVIAQAMERGLFIDWFLHCDTALRLCPPLNIAEEEADWAVATLQTALQAVAEPEKTPNR